MEKTTRLLAKEILDTISQSQAFAQQLLDEQLTANQLSGSADGRLLTHLVYGTLRMQGHLDWIIGRLYRGDYSQLDNGIKNILRLGLYQLKFSDRLPAFAVVDEMVKIAKIKDAARSGLVNAILRNYLRRGRSLSFPERKKNEADYIAALHSHPPWLVRRWLEQLGSKETTAMCQADNELPPVTVRINSIKTSRMEMERRLGASGFQVKATPFSPDGIIVESGGIPIQKTEFFQQGYLRLQDEGAQLIVPLLNPQAEDSILDACSGTGGKTTHLAAIMKNTGQIVALDNSRDKIKHLQLETARLGITNVEAMTADLSETLPVILHRKFDGVLLDAPCSGLGTLRRNPEIKWRTTESDVEKCAATQQKFLQNASLAVKNGGRLVYCTCSLLPQENEDVIRSFLKLNDDFNISAPDCRFSSDFTDREGFFRIFPHLHNTDGFFAAVLKRK